MLPVCLVVYSDVENENSQRLLIGWVNALKKRKDLGRSYVWHDTLSKLRVNHRIKCLVTANVVYNYNFAIVAGS
jgi:hypothetical protein